MKGQRRTYYVTRTSRSKPRLSMQLRQRRREQSERDKMVSYGSNMAADARKVRVEQQLKVKIGEAKNLAGRNSGPGGNTGYVYVTIALDQEEICRTPTIERTTNPFIGEEYNFDVPRPFRLLAVYVWDRDRHLKQDKPIGKVAIRREELHTYNHKDHWFSLRPVDADSEVQGMMHVQVSLECQGSIKKGDCDEWSSFDEHRSSLSRSDLGSWQNKRRTPTHVKVRIPECADLAKKNGTCDPFVSIVAEYSNNKKITKRTKIRKKTVNPEYDENFFFDLVIDNECKQDSNNTYKIHPYGGADLNQVVISVWHDSPGMSDNIFLGEVKIPMRGKQQQNAVQPDAWYYLQPRTSHSRPNRSCATPPGTRLSSLDNSIGSLRLNIVYTADNVFPLATYDRLMDLLIGSIHRRPIVSSSVYLLGEIVPNKTDIAQPLVRLFTYKNLIVPMIKALADHEISNLTDPTTIFRGNTLVSKMMDEAMRLSGLHYLRNTLRPVLELIFSERKPCEIDPARVADKSAIRTNLLNLQDYVERVFNAIINSAVRCPTVLCQIFHDLRECAAKHFPSNREVRYSVVSGFIFLRFFAPAILGPKLFDLTTEKLDPQTTRTLTLISKTIQSLGNLVSSRSAQHTCKEEYTEELYKKFCTENHLEAVKRFLEVISTVGTNNNEDTLLEPVLLKEGREWMMTKRAQRQKRFGRRNFKQRYFRLTTQSLSYAKSKGKPPICDIPLKEILAVERLQEQSFKKQNIFQIIRKDRVLYVQTTNCVEEKEWVDLLSKICHSNAQRLECFHPCAFINGMWSCCRSTDGNAPGCSQVSNKPFQMELATDLDPSRDLQRLHTLIMNHKLSLESKYAEDVVCRELIQAAYELEEIHCKRKEQILLETRYGSRMAPIGEDNYLNIMKQQHHQQQQQQHHAQQQHQHFQQQQQQYQQHHAYIHHHQQSAHHHQPSMQLCEFSIGHG